MLVKNNLQVLYPQLVKYVYIWSCSISSYFFLSPKYFLLLLRTTLTVFFLAGSIFHMFLNNVSNRIFVLRFCISKQMFDKKYYIKNAYYIIHFVCTSCTTFKLCCINTQLFSIFKTIYLIVNIKPPRNFPTIFRYIYNFRAITNFSILKMPELTPFLRAMIQRLSWCHRCQNWQLEPWPDVFLYVIDASVDS